MNFDIVRLPSQLWRGGRSLEMFAFIPEFGVFPADADSKDAKVIDVPNSE